MKPARSIVAGVLPVVLAAVGMPGVARCQFEAQHIVFEWVGQPVDLLFGKRAGDVDRDGVPDLILTAPVRNVGTLTYAGTVEVRSGKNGRLLYRWAGTQWGQGFGGDVADAGDVNKDGHDDVLVSAGDLNATTNGEGVVQVYSGKDGKVLYTIAAKGRWDLFGQSLAGLGDINLDGYDDFACGAPQIPPFNNAPKRPGYVKIYSGKDGKLLHHKVGDHVGDEFYIVRSVGDIDQDGFPDFAIGATGHNIPNRYKQGYVHVYSGRDGKIMGTIHSRGTDHLFAISMAGAGDVNKDGWPDIAIGTLFGRYAMVVSGRWLARRQGQQVLYVWTTNRITEHYGMRVCAMGDQNGDGYADVAVASPAFGSNGMPFVDVRSGKDGKVLWKARGTTLFYTASHIDSADFNGDGIPELIASGSNYGRNTALKSPHGRVDVLSVKKLVLSTNTHRVSMTSGGTQTLLVDADFANKGRNYWILGSATGTWPGVRLPSAVGSVTLPLIPDPYTDATIALANTGPWVKTRGVLDFAGTALASIQVPKVPSAIGVVLYHACLVYDAKGFYLASNPTSLLGVK